MGAQGASRPKMVVSGAGSLTKPLLTRGYNSLTVTAWAYAMGAVCPQGSAALPLWATAPPPHTRIAERVGRCLVASRESEL